MTAKKRKTIKGKGSKKYQMAGARTQHVPAASFLEQPTAQPFAGDPSLQNNPNEFVAKKGGKRKKDNKKKKRFYTTVKKKNTNKQKGYKRKGGKR